MLPAALCFFSVHEAVSVACWERQKQGGSVMDAVADRTQVLFAQVPTVASSGTRVISWSHGWIMAG